MIFFLHIWSVLLSSAVTFLRMVWCGVVWWWLLPLLVIGYMSVLYAMLTIIPRYLFPVMPLYAVLAAVFLAAPRKKELAAPGS